MSDRNKAVSDEVLNKEFLSQFKSEADVSKFLKQLHAQVLEKMLEGEMDVHLGYEKNSVSGNNSGNSRNGSYLKKIPTEHGESVIDIPVTAMGNSSLLLSLNMKVVVYPSKSLSSHSMPRE